MDRPAQILPASTSGPVLPTAPFLGQPIEICIVTPDLRGTLAGLVRLGIGPFQIYRFDPTTVDEQTFDGQPCEFTIDVAFAQPGGPQGMIWEVMSPVSGPSVMREFLDNTVDGRGGIHHVAFDCGDGHGARLKAPAVDDDLDSAGDGGPDADDPARETAALNHFPSRGSSEGGEQDQQYRRSRKAVRKEAARRRALFEARGFPLRQSGVWRGRRGCVEFMYFDTTAATTTCFEAYVFSADWEDPDDVEIYPCQSSS